MRSVSNDFDEWLLQVNEDSWMKDEKTKTKKTCEAHHHHHQCNDDDDDSIINFGELSLVSINSISDECLYPSHTSSTSGNNKKKKRVSWGEKVEIREYPIIQGDHPKCTLPLTIDWVSIGTLYKSIDDSRERQTHYDSPKRFSLDDRREKLYGSVQSNLADFEYMETSLNDLLRGLDDYLNEATKIEELPTLLQPGEPILSLPPMMPLSSTTTETTSSSIPLPKSLLAYEEFFSSTATAEQFERPEPPCVHWTRVVATAC